MVVAVLTVTGRLFHIFGAEARKARAAVSVFVVTVVTSILFVDRSDRAGRWSLIYSRRYSGC
jgi:hypothetical protein